MIKVQENTMIQRQSFNHGDYVLSLRIETTVSRNYKSLLVGTFR